MNSDYLLSVYYYRGHPFERQAAPALPAAENALARRGNGRDARSILDPSLDMFGGMDRMLERSQGMFGEMNKLMEQMTNGMKMDMVS